MDATENKLNAQKAKVEAKRNLIASLREARDTEYAKGYETSLEVKEAVWAIVDKIDYAERALKRLIKNAIKIALHEAEEFENYFHLLDRYDIIELNREYDFVILHKGRGNINF